MEELCDHPAITSKEYAYGLVYSWEDDISMILFPFLLTRADKSDLEEVKDIPNMRMS